MEAHKKFSYSFFERLINNRKFVIAVWLAAALYGSMHAGPVDKKSNYVIYKYAYLHASQETNLYSFYPADCADVNLYGPLFSLIIAPFSCLPDKAGAFLWVMMSAVFLLFAITQLPIPGKWKNILILLSSQELMITSAALQTNALVCACLILGFVYTHKGRNFWALFFIMAASFIKIYGLAGLAFFFLSRKKMNFIGSALAWSIAFFFAPLIIIHLNFLIQSYQDWYEGLRIKAAKNILPGEGILYQNVSVPGMIRRIFYPALNDTWVLVSAFVLFLSQYRHYSLLKDIRYQLYLLCSVLITTVIFSTGSESSTYIIVMPGMCLWYLLQPKTKGLNIFFAIAFLLTTFAYSDIFTPWSRRHLYRPYSLKAFFPFVIWVILLIQIHLKQFLKAINPLKFEQG